MIISPFTPLFFEKHKSDGIESRYIQTFAQTDQILIELFVEKPFISTPTVAITQAEDSVLGQILMTLIKIGDGYMYFCIITGLSNGVYSISITPWGLQSQPFRVTDDEEELSRTTLIQYSMKDNKQRQDAVFIIDGMRYFFDFRVPGGFKDSGWTFSVENEQFITPEADPIELFALESTQKKFTMGYQEGVPVYFAELLNRVLTCSYVYFDGVRYARKDSSVPEMNVQIEGLDSFVFTQLLQKVNNLNPTLENSNHLIMRRVQSNFGDTLYRATAISDNTLNKRIIQ